MTAVVYARVSAAEQNLDRRLDSVHSYAQNELQILLNDFEVYRDKCTGTDTSRSRYREIMDTVQVGDIDHVIVHEISRLTRSFQDLERTVSRITGNGAAIHFVRDGLSFGDGKERPMHKLQTQMVGAFVEWQTRVKPMNTKEGIAARQQEDDHHHGRPPLGFENEDGRLIEGGDCDRVCAVLEMVAKGELSKRKTARGLNTSRSTISRAITRGHLYGLSCNQLTLYHNRAILICFRERWHLGMTIHSWPRRKPVIIQTT